MCASLCARWRREPRSAHGSAAVHRACVCVPLISITFHTIRYLPPTEVDATARRIGRTPCPPHAAATELGGTEGPARRTRATVTSVSSGRQKAEVCRAAVGGAVGLGSRRRGGVGHGGGTRSGLAGRVRSSSVAGARSTSDVTERISPAAAALGPPCPPRACRGHGRGRAAGRMCQWPVGPSRARGV